MDIIISAVGFLIVLGITIMTYLGVDDDENDTGQDGL